MIEWYAISAAVLLTALVLANGAEALSEKLFGSRA